MKRTLNVDGRTRGKRRLGVLVATALAVTATSSHAQMGPLENAGHYLRRTSFGPQRDLLTDLWAGGNAAVSCYLESQLQGVSPSQVTPPCAITHADHPLLPNLLQDILDDGGPGWTLEKIQRHQIANMLHSKWQLRELLTYFWLSHFSTDYKKIETEVSKVPFLLGPPPFPSDEAAAGLLFAETEGFRTDALGHFEDLLRRSALGPAMLFYLDNWLNIPENGKPGNENFPRELLELHTLGLDAETGAQVYTEYDVEETAKAFTAHSVEYGSTATEPLRYLYYDQYHLDADLPQGNLFAALDGGLSSIDLGTGAQQVDTILNFLAERPETGAFLSRKLYRYLVSEDPMPAGLSGMCVASWTSPCSSHTPGRLGCIEDVCRILLNSTEMLDAAQQWSKVNSPLETVIATARALDGQSCTTVCVGPACTIMHCKEALDDALTTLNGPLAQSLYRFPSPDGYPQESPKFLSSSQILNRTNYNLRIHSGLQTDFSGQLSYDLSSYLPTLGISLSAQSGINSILSFFLFQGSAEFTPAEFALGRTYISQDLLGNPVSFASLIAGGQLDELQSLLHHYAAYMASRPLMLQK